MGWALAIAFLVLVLVISGLVALVLWLRAKLQKEQTAVDRLTAEVAGLHVELVAARDATRAAETRAKRSEAQKDELYEELANRGAAGGGDRVDDILARLRPHPDGAHPGGDGGGAVPARPAGATEAAGEITVPTRRRGI